MLSNMTNSSTCMEAQSLSGSVLTPMLILDFVLGLPGNILALWLLSFKAPWKSANIFLLNLVLADVLLLIAVPFHIDNVLRGSWIFGDFFCRFHLFMILINQSGSIVFMTVLVMDRFYRIVHPHHPVCHMSIRSTVLLICGIWIVIVIIRVPLLMTQLLKSSRNSPGLLCQSISIWTDAGLGMRVYRLLHVVEFAIAFLVVIFFSVRIFYQIHGNRKLRKHRRVKRTIYLLLTVLMMFTFCFLPNYITGSVAFFISDISSCSTYIVVCEVFSVSLCLVFLNIALDSILYNLSFAYFRDTLKETVNSTGLTKYRLSVKEKRAPRRF